MFKVKHQLRIM